MTTVDSTTQPGNTADSAPDSSLVDPSQQSEKGGTCVLIDLTMTSSSEGESSAQSRNGAAPSTAAAAIGLAAPNSDSVLPSLIPVMGSVQPTATPAASIPRVSMVELPSMFGGNSSSDTGEKLTTTGTDDSSATSNKSRLLSSLRSSVSPSKKDSRPSSLKENPKVESAGVQSPRMAAEKTRKKRKRSQDRGNGSSSDVEGSGKRKKRNHRRKGREGTQHSDSHSDSRRGRSKKKRRISASDTEKDTDDGQPSLKKRRKTADQTNHLLFKGDSTTPTMTVAELGSLRDALSSISRDSSVQSIPIIDPNNFDVIASSKQQTSTLLSSCKSGSSSSNNGSGTPFVPRVPVTTTLSDALGLGSPLMSNSGKDSTMDMLRMGDLLASPDPNLQLVPPIMVDGSPSKNKKKKRKHKSDAILSSAVGLIPLVHSLKNSSLKCAVSPIPPGMRVKCPPYKELRKLIRRRDRIARIKGGPSLYEIFSFSRDYSKLAKLKDALHQLFPRFTSDEINRYFLHSRKFLMLVLFVFSHPCTELTQYKNRMAMHNGDQYSDAELSDLASLLSGQPKPQTSVSSTLQCCSESTSHSSVKSRITRNQQFHVYISDCAVQRDRTLEEPDVRDLVNDVFNLMVSDRVRNRKGQDCLAEIPDFCMAECIESVHSAQSSAEESCVNSLTESECKWVCRVCDNSSPFLGFGGFQTRMANGSGGTGNGANGLHHRNPDETQEERSLRKKIKRIRKLDCLFGKGAYRYEKHAKYHYAKWYQYCDEVIRLPKDPAIRTRIFKGLVDLLYHFGVFDVRYP